MIDLPERPTIAEIEEIYVTEELARKLRNAYLAETDWWGLSDHTMTQAETDYRQALRDVPQQEGFPLVITWPTKPE